MKIKSAIKKIKIKKKMKKIKLYNIILFIAGVLLWSCSKTNKDVLIPYPEDINFEDQALGTFTFNIPNAPFSSGDAKTGIVTMNVKNNGDGTFSGFAVSNKNWRSYPWGLSPDFGPATPSAAQIKAGIDSTIFSVYTTLPNRTNNYLVACVKDDDANITLKTPGIVEHVLVANTTYNWLLETYGSTFSGTLDANSQLYSLTGTKVRNVQNPNTSTAFYGRFALPGPTGNNDIVRLAGKEIIAKKAAGKVAADAARLAGKTPAQVIADSTAAYNATFAGYVKLTVNGFNGSTPTGSVDYWLAIRPNVDAANPTLNYIAPDWFSVDLTSLGSVNKLVFHLSSSYSDAFGNMLLPPYFCLDGIRLKK